MPRKPQQPKRRRRSDGPMVRVKRPVDPYEDDGVWGYRVDQMQEDMNRDRWERYRGRMGEGE